MVLFLLGIIAVAWAGGTATGWFMRGHYDALDSDEAHIRAFQHETETLSRINMIRRPGA